MQGIAQKILANPAKYSIDQLKQGVQNGVIPAYVGIPLIQEKMKEMKEAQVMAMGQQQQRPVAEQILQEAQGVPALSSNLPQEYAGGGIVAFAEGGAFEDDEDDEDPYEKEMTQATSMMNALRQRISDMYRAKQIPSSDPGIAELMPALMATESKEGISVKKGDEPPKSIERRTTSVSQPTDLESLIALVKQKESGGRRNDKEGKLLTSPKGAMGEMQVMPGTARDPGFGIAPARAGDADDLARVGEEYFAKMLQRYGDPKLAAVAYNWGPGNTDKWLMAGADPSRLPKETRNYIKGFDQGGIVGLAGGDLIIPPADDLEKQKDMLRRMRRIESARAAFNTLPAAEAATTAAAEAPKAVSGIRSLLGRLALPLGIATTGAEATKAYMDKKQKEELEKYGPEPELTEEEIARASKPAFMRDVSTSRKVQEERGIKPLAPLTYTPAGVETYGERPNYTPPSKENRTPDVITPIADQVVTPQTLAPLQAAPALEAAAEEAAPAEQPAALTSGTDDMAELRKQIAESMAGLKGQREIDNYMSLLSAGLGIMGGTSPYALSNIGAGAMQGIGAYQRAAQLRGAEQRGLLSAQLGLGKLAGYDAYKQEALGLRKDIAEAEASRKRDAAKDAAAAKAATLLERQRKTDEDILANMERQAEKIVESSGKLAALENIGRPADEIARTKKRLTDDLLMQNKRYQSIYSRLYPGVAESFGESKIREYDPKTGQLK
jgi:hypothetical protein